MPPYLKFIFTLSNIDLVLIDDCLKILAIK